MHLELVELLRCPVNHAPSVLVASADEIENRYVKTGLLGCPECLAEYPVREGVTHFAKRTNEHQRSPNIGATTVDRDTAMRLAAQLGISAGRTVFVLIGFRVEMAIAMREIVPARMLVLNAPPSSSIDVVALTTSSLAAPLGVADCNDILPLVARKFDGIAMAKSHATPMLMQQTVELLRPGARLVAPASAVLPAGMREMVRDDVVWVAEREAVASAPISLVRR